MKTYEKLAAKLREVGLEEMAKKADTGYYHDYLSPLDFPEMQLAQDLFDAMRAADKALGWSDGKIAKVNAIAALRNAVINGDYDADLAESDEWIESREGQDAMRMIARRNF